MPSDADAERQVPAASGTNAVNRTELPLPEIPLVATKDAAKIANAANNLRSSALFNFLRDTKANTHTRCY
jgi:hypothetical protein